jgi:hypothetical protein
MGSADDQQLSCLLTVLFVNGNDKVRLKFAAFNFFAPFSGTLIAGARWLTPTSNGQVVE